VQAERAAQKSRLVIATEPLSVPAEPAYLVQTRHPEFGLTLAAHGGAFAGARIDIGTRVLLEILEEIPAATDVIDLGCGTGALAAAYALRHPDARVTATDRSAAAVASARATMVANGLADRVTVTHDDAGSDLPDAGADLLLLNPPFHLGTSVETRAATRLFEASARLLRPGGELWTVYNSSLAYKAELAGIVGPTEQMHRTPKFTVTRSIRR
jgi:16S rRNA (guanine1207-N2)-methyltransferase